MLHAEQTNVLNATNVATSPASLFHLWSKGNGFEHLCQLWKNVEESHTII
jgi:hypothetical protein